MICKKITQETNEYQFYTTETVKDVDGNDVQIPKEDGIYTKEQLDDLINYHEAQKAKYQGYRDAINNE